MKKERNKNISNKNNNNKLQNIEDRKTFRWRIKMNKRVTYYVWIAIYLIYCIFYVINKCKYNFINMSILWICINGWIVFTTLFYT